MQAMRTLDQVSLKPNDRQAVANVQRIVILNPIAAA